MAKKPKLHPFIKWMRGIGAASFLLGVGALMAPDFFWWGIAGIYLGFLCAALDVGFEPDFKGKWKWKVSAWAFFAVCVGIITWKLVLVSAPMFPWGNTTDGEYPDNTIIAGIPWQKEFTELRVQIPNPSEHEYSDLDLVIRPSEPIVAIAQSSTVPGVYFSDKNEIWIRALAKSKVHPLDLLANDAGYRMRCAKLPAKSDIMVSIALANVKWGLLAPSVDDPMFVMKARNDSDFSTYWFGHKGGDIYSLRSSSSMWIRIEGSYVAVHRTRTIATTIKVEPFAAMQQ